MVHDKYTLSIHNMVDKNIPFFDYDYPLKNTLKEEFEKNFIEYYEFSEICFYSPYEFRQRLRSLLHLKSGYYNKLFEVCATKFNPLINNCLVENGVKDVEKINIRKYDSLKNQITSLYDQLENLKDENFKQNTEEQGETTFKKDADTHTHEVKITMDDRIKNEVVDFDEKVETLETLDENIEVNEELIKNTGKTVDKDSEKNIETDGESEKIGSLKEETTSVVNTINSDTPQSDLNTMTPTVENMLTRYATSLSRADTKSNHKADTKENVTTHEDKKENFEELEITDEEVNQTTVDLTERSQTVDTLKETGSKEQTHETQDNVEDIDDVEDINYHEENEGTHHFINDKKHKMLTKEETSQDQTSHADSSLFGNDRYDLTEGEKQSVVRTGVVNQSISDLLNKYYDSVRNILFEFVQEFEVLFMGIF